MRRVRKGLHKIRHSAISQAHTLRRTPICMRCVRKGFLKSQAASRKHKHTHTGERPHSCEVCGKAFKDSSTLAKHKRFTREERPFSCMCVERLLVSHATLAVHKRTHTGSAHISMRCVRKGFYNIKPPRCTSVCTLESAHIHAMYAERLLKIQAPSPSTADSHGKAPIFMRCVRKGFLKSRAHLEPYTHSAPTREERPIFMRCVRKGFFNV